MKKSKIGFKFILVLLTASLLLCCLSGCVTLGDRNPTATILFSTGKSATIRLYYDKAPNTVKNFISLAQSGFYDGLSVHRIVINSIVQMGDPNGDGSGNAGYYIKGEFSNNGYKKNDLSHTSGTVSMARKGTTDANAADYYDTASCQFFITVGEKVGFDGDYAAFGKVIEGMDYIMKISEMDVDSSYTPLDELYIESITINTYGKDYGKPKTIKIKD